jgi:hypothetical protein
MPAMLARIVAIAGRAPFYFGGTAVVAVQPKSVA